MSVFLACAGGYLAVALWVPGWVLGAPAFWRELEASGIAARDMDPEWLRRVLVCAAAAWPAIGVYAALWWGARLCGRWRSG